MIALKLALRNLFGAGLRTWLNVSVLSFAYVVCLFYNGYLDGWNQHAHYDMKAWETGSGQLWHPAYDPHDPYCLQDAHAPVSDSLQWLITSGKITPVLIVQATIFPQGRMQNVLMKGIDPRQPIVQLPAKALDTLLSAIPAIIGKRMASAARLNRGDRVLVRWRDKNGTFDAREIQILDIFSSNVPLVDLNTVWIPLSTLQQMTGYEKEATLFIAGNSYIGGNLESWVFKDQKFLLKEVDEIIRSKKSGSVLIYGLLLVIALLAIFDTQVLSVFRRQKEIGTYIALGLTRWKVVGIFTIEGAAHSILAIILGSLYGIPLFAFLNKNGIPMPKVVDSYGITISDRIFPSFSIGLVVTTTLLVVLSATIVSFFPARRIAKIKPTDALKGKIS